MTKLRVLAVDDEPLALRRLRVILDHLPDAELVGEAGSCAQGLELSRRLRPDVILLDIKMRDGTGFDLLKALPDDEHAPAVIFVSAFDAFATKAFENAAVDYVLKPVELHRLRSALQRAGERLDGRRAQEEIANLKSVISALREGIGGSSAPRYESEFWIRRRAGGFIRVPVDAINWVSSEDEYVRLHTASESYLIRSSIKSFEERVDPAEFIRVHRKALVKTAAIVRIHPAGLGAYEVELATGEKVRSGRIYARTLRELVSGTRQARPVPGTNLEVRSPVGAP